MLGQVLSHYRILKKLGSGGMGEVYLAHDTKLDRSVALKILRSEFAGNPKFMDRFSREAKAASAINHPNVAHIYEIGEAEGIHFIAMEYLEGESLDLKTKKGALPSNEIVEIGLQIASALEEAHNKGVVHRDLKPANIVLTSRDQLKLLDFGLAKMTLVTDQDLASAYSTVVKTEEGMIIGTYPYMSPEQLTGEDLDQLTDLYSLGVTLYELSTGTLPFQGKTRIELADAILHKECIPANQTNKNISPNLAKIISKLLAKKAKDRYQSATELRSDLKKIVEQEASPKSWMQLAKKPSFMFPAFFVIALLFSLFFWSIHKNNRAKWARDVGMPQVLKLADEAKFQEAVEIASQVERYIPNDPILRRLYPTISKMLTIRTEPPGAEIFMKEYRAVDEPWLFVGNSPIEKMRIPKGYFRWKISKQDFGTINFVAPKAFYEGDGEHSDQINLRFTLDRKENIPSGMVKVQGGKYFFLGSRFRSVKDADLEDYWIDEYEVSNKEFKKFVDSGGYQKQQFWKHPFIKDGRTLSWEEAMTYFRDAAGQTGPLEWELGKYPEGNDNFPVSGVSWYEAAAYAEFIGKSLPTIYHWDYAAGTPMTFVIAPLSNFSARSPWPVGNVKSMSPFGTYDMAGNMKEWCWNETMGDKRFILGGDFTEPEYLFYEADQRSPFDREKTFGFRCIKYFSESAIPAALQARVEENLRDYRQEKPVSDEVFEVLRGFYTYDPKELNAKLESIKEERYWKKETVTVDTPYGNERLILHIFLPKNTLPPYQTVIYFPGSWAMLRTSSVNIEEDIGYREYVDFIVRSGRAAIHPIYQGTYERGGRTVRSSPRSIDEVRNGVFQDVKDVSRTIDYLQTRDDIDEKRLVYYGYSWGGRMGSIVGAVEPRFRTLILAHGGFRLLRLPPEIDELNFVPRIKMPVLMIDGRYDHIAPVETSQEPMFNLLGTQPNDKLHLIYDGSHFVPREKTIRPILEWLDKYLGPIR